MKPRLGAGPLRASPILRTIWNRRTEWLGKAIGATLGLVAGWFGLAVGLIVGGLTDELLKQGRADRSLVKYLECPGPGQFEEPAPGSAAFCALAVLIAAEVSVPRLRRFSSASEGIGLSDRIARSASVVFGLRRDSLPTLESFVRVSSLKLGRLNPDLLAESLAARTRALRDLSPLLAALADFAKSRAGADMVARVRAVVGSDRLDGEREPADSQSLAGADPWVVLGIAKDASTEDVKAAFRRIAVEVHPDSTVASGDEEKRAAAESFMRVEAAYREILRTKNSIS